MKATLVRYRTKPEQTDENQRLIEAVFEELRIKKPVGMCYVALRLGDGTFVHFATTNQEASTLTSLEAFRAFQGGVRQRCLELPQVSEATIIGGYRMFGE
jgi:hypothetical protein